MLKQRLAGLTDFLRVEPALAPLYKTDPEVLARLPEVWREMIESIALLTGIVERTSAADEAVPVAFGSSVFLSEEFLEPMLVGQHPHSAVRVAHEISAGSPGVLDGNAVRAAQEDDRLTMLILHSVYPSDPSGQPIGVPADLAHYEALASLLMQETRGLRLRQIVAEVYSEGMLTVFESSGFRTISSHAGQTPSLDHPVLMCVSREDVQERPGLRIGTAFTYFPPRLSLRSNHAELIREAVKEKSDGEIAQALGISISAVKHRWVTLYRFLEEEHPEAIPSLPRNDPFDGGRGSERRRHVMSYFRAHPEEIRGF